MSTDREPLGACYLVYIKSTIIFSFTESIDTSSIRTSSSTVYVGCIYRDLYVVIKISILEEVSSLLEPVICSTTTTCRYCGIGVPKISLVNEVQCQTGTEWRDLIGQH